MTDISFYHLTATPLESALSRLLEKVLESGAHVVVLAGSDERVEELNTALWTFNPRSFLPHGSKADGRASEQPVYLTASNENPNGATVLAITDCLNPDFITNYSKCLYLFDGNSDSQTTAARQQWQVYKSANHNLTYWKQNAKGGWEKGA